MAAGGNREVWTYVSISGLDGLNHDPLGVVYHRPALHHGFFMSSEEQEKNNMVLRTRN